MNEEAVNAPATLEVEAMRDVLSMGVGKDFCWYFAQVTYGADNTPAVEQK